MTTSISVRSMGGPSTTRWSNLTDKEAVGAWDSLPASTSWDSAFGALSFQSAIESVTRFSVEQLTISDEKGVSAAARIPILRRFGVAFASVPPFTAYSAIRLRDDLRESDVHDRASVLEDLLEAIERRFHAAALHLPPEIHDIRTFSWRGWNVRPLYTYRIFLNPALDPAEAWSESAKRIARQHAPDFELVEADAETQARLVVESYLRSGRKPALGESEIAALSSNLQEEGSVKNCSARNLASGEIEASVTLLQNGDEAYYWLAGSQPGAAMTVLLASLLPELASDGVRVFDFIGANTASIAEFKRRFGGQLTTYFRTTWRRGLIGRLAAGRV